MNAGGFHARRSNRPDTDPIRLQPRESPGALRAGYCTDAQTTDALTWMLLTAAAVLLRNVTSQPATPF